MSLKMQLRGSQQLTITPVMHYFIQLLADNHLELLETLQNEVEANPMLEIETPEKIVNESDANEYQKRIERADTSFLTPYEDHGFLRKNPDDIDKSKALEVLTPSSVSLADHLLEQAMSTFSSDSEFEVARQIIYNLDGDGYLKIEIESIASLIQTTPAEIERERAVPADRVRRTDVGARPAPVRTLRGVENGRAPVPFGHRGRLARGIRHRAVPLVRAREQRFQHEISLTGRGRNRRG